MFRSNSCFEEAPVSDLPCSPASLHPLSPDSYEVSPALGSVRLRPERMTLDILWDLHQFDLVYSLSSYSWWRDVSFANFLSFVPFRKSKTLQLLDVFN